ncbi:hypothetical protein [Nonomuraea recticatena]|uniref:DUF5134 domain-containing protein n=1 Tax=Nonomuraea recticatena TaxID=46178 RepID=A0ABP6FKQ5_9ACTN
MDIAAPITWVITALGGFSMLGIWIARGGARGGASRLPVPAERHFPVPVVAGHGLAAVGTVVLVLLTALGLGG